MKFIHAVVLTEEEMENGHYDTGDWGDLTDGDYVVHCLYSVDNEQIIFLEDNGHQPIVTIIESFLDGVRYAGSMDCGGLLIDCSEIKVTKAFVVVDNDKQKYTGIGVKEKLTQGNYGEVM